MNVPKCPLLALVLVAAPVAAEVKSVTPAGFESENQIVVPVTPTEAWDAIGRISDWWNPAHTHSGLAGNLELRPEVGGCFCEALEGGGTVEHLRVVYADPGLMLRLQGGLGPLQSEAVAGTLTWRLEPVEDGTRITQTYVVGGFIRAGTEAYAAPVDRVIAEQLSRLAAHLAR
jgi:hypothetical protein